MSFYKATLDTPMLKQYGVKGMKWYQTLMSSKKKNAEKRAKSIELQNKTPRNKSSIKKMTDQELKEKIERMQLEERYKKLLDSLDPPAQPKSSRVKKVITDMLESGARDIGSQATSYIIGTMINQITGQDVVNPKKAHKPK